MNTLLPKPRIGVDPRVWVCLTRFMLVCISVNRDEPLINRIVNKPRSNDHRFSAALETINLSKPFRDHRGLIEVLS